jgi:hypothetical protein
MCLIRKWLALDEVGMRPPSLDNLLRRQPVRASSQRWNAVTRSSRADSTPG